MTTDIPVPTTNLADELRTIAPVIVEIIERWHGFSLTYVIDSSDFKHWRASIGNCEHRGFTPSEAVRKLWSEWDKAEQLLGSRSSE